MLRLEKELGRQFYCKYIMSIVVQITKKLVGNMEVYVEDFNFGCYSSKFTMEVFDKTKL